MGKKTTITNLPLYATNSKGERVERFKVVWLGPVAIGCIKDNTTEKTFLQLHCENCEVLQAQNKRLKEALKKYGAHDRCCRWDTAQHCSCGLRKALKETK